MQGHYYIHNLNVNNLNTLNNFLEISYKELFLFQILTAEGFVQITCTRGIFLRHSFSLTALCTFVFSRRIFKIVPSQKEDK